MSSTANTARSRSIRHPQNVYTGAEMIGGGNGNGSNSGGNRRLSTRSGGTTGASSTAVNSRSSAATGGNGNGNRESMAEFQDLLYHTNYAATHYDEQPTSPLPVQQHQQQVATAVGVTQTQPLRLGHDSSDQFRSKAPVDTCRVRNSLPKPNPYAPYSNPLSQYTPSGPVRSSNKMATSSSPPTKPSRNNTTNLHDFAPAVPNQETRQRKLSLPGSTPDKHNDFDGNGNAAFPGEFINTMVTQTPPPLRSRSVKNKKGMLSFMRGAFPFIL